MQKLLDDIRTEMDVLKGSIGRMEQRLDELQNKFAELNKLLQTGTRFQTPEAVVRQEIVEEREPIPTRQEVKITEPSSAPVHVSEEQPSPSAILGERIKPATDLRHAVSLNDSFRFTRELFGGDAARMNRDMTFRAIRILKEADLILAEDTRTSGILLKHFEIKNAMQSHHKFNEHKTVESVVNRIKGGETVALISDAGTPGISDPGFLVARECARNGVEVECLPGATAFVPALVASGLPCDRFCFEGFLPQKKGRMTRLKVLAEESRTMVFYESPYRLVKTLTQFAECFGAERQASVSREISKVHEETVRGTLSDLVAHFTANEPRGEIVIVIAGIDKE